jgi:circadian clock protein KaiB
MSKDTTARFEAAAQAHCEHYVLRLYTVGPTAMAQRAIANIKEICEADLPGRYTLEVVDITEQPELAVEVQIVAAPTLVKVLPEPVTKLIGDLSNRHQVVLGLDLPQDGD